MTDPAVSAVVLAAGTSSRMGASNKLLCEIGGQSVIRRVLRQLAKSDLDEIILVTGHQASELVQQTGNFDGKTVLNPDYTDGMSTSIRAGIGAVSCHVSAAIICQADMPFISADLYNQLVRAHIQNPSQVIIPTFMNRRGNPLLWPATFFPSLMKLEGDRGARSLFRENRDHLHWMETGNIGILLDIDDPQALELFKSLIEQKERAHAS